MAANIANSDGTGNMLCSSVYPTQTTACITSFNDGGTYGETKIVSGNTLVDFVGITTDSYDPFNEGQRQAIGIIRNYDGTPANLGSNTLRCFTSVSNVCSAPANSVRIPEAMPYLINKLPVVSYATELATENANDGSPARQIPGALMSGSWSFDAVPYNQTTCAQGTHVANTTTDYVAYVSQIPFSGSIGTRDAIVTDGFAVGPPNHIERFYYVQGYGRVRESVSWEAPGTTIYDNDPADHKMASNVLHNLLKPLSSSVININGAYAGNGCPQGSAVPLH